MTDETMGYARVLGLGAAAAPFYVTGEDNLAFQSRTSVSVTITIEGRFLDTSGEVRPFVFNVVNSTTTRAVQTFNTHLGEGWILSTAVRVTSGTPQIGQTFVQLRVTRGESPAGINIGTLIQGYVTESDDLAWPGSPIRSSIEGPGFLRSFTSVDPAAGSEIGISVPARTRWRLQTISFVLVTGAVAGNREVNLNILDLVGTIARVPSGTNQIISTTIGYSFFLGAIRGVGAAATWIINPMPAIFLATGWGINTFTSGLDATDNYTSAELVIEEWIED